MPVGTLPRCEKIETRLYFLVARKELVTAITRIAIRLRQEV